MAKVSIWLLSGLAKAASVAQHPVRARRTPSTHFQPWFGHVHANMYVARVNERTGRICTACASSTHTAIIPNKQAFPSLCQGSFFPPTLASIPPLPFSPRLLNGGEQVWMLLNAFIILGIKKSQV